MSNASRREWLLERWSKFPRLTGDESKIVLMGDSVLDNFYWLQNPLRSLRAVVEERLKEAKGADNPPSVCLNFAVDQMMTFDMTDRGRENNWGVYQRARRAWFGDGSDPLDRDGYDHLCGPDGRIRSAENLACLHNVQHVVLSCGGNDVYLRAEVQAALIKSLLLCDRRREVADAMGERLKKGLCALRAAAPDARFTLVVCYHPHYEFSISGLSGCIGSIASGVQRRKLSWMVTPAVRRMLHVALETGCDVIDLSQTFDPRNVRHYGNMDMSDGGWSGAEPSDVSQEFIAALCCDVMKYRSLWPDAAPTCFHGVTDGDTYVRSEYTVLTEAKIERYTFRDGF